MAKTPAQRGRIGNWLRESRLARGYSSASEAREQIEKLTGWRVPQSVYAEWESGRRVPSEENLGRLRAFFGNEPEAPRATSDTAEIVAALWAQADAIKRLADVLEAQSKELGEGMMSLGAALGVVLHALGGLPAQMPPVRAAPGQTSDAG